jgi:hypothetical protein
MNDEDFLLALESCELPEQDFGHAAHVRAAYLYLQTGDFAAALERTRRSIRNYASRLGKPDRYHETITVAYVALIQQHMCERGHSGGWNGFARDNPELLNKNLLQEFYPAEQLSSDAARKIFLLPRARMPPQTTSTEHKPVPDRGQGIT